MEDCEIIDLYFKRSESAIKETADKYGGYLKTVAWHILNSRGDSEHLPACLESHTPDET